MPTVAVVGGELAVNVGAPPPEPPPPERPLVVVHVKLVVVRVKVISAPQYEDMTPCLTQATPVSHVLALPAVDPPARSLAV